MATYTGFKVINPYGHTIISSDAITPHFAGEASYLGSQGGLSTSWPGFTGPNYANSLTGCIIHRFSIVGSSSNYPLFFIRPTVTGIGYGILRQWNSDNTHYIDVIQSGVSSYAPKVYAFMNPSLISGSSGNGLITRLADGTISFDSNKKPLAIYHGASVIPPQLPCDGGEPYEQSGFDWNDFTLDWNFKCNTTFNTYYNDSLLNKSGLMFNAPSSINAVYSRIKNGFKRSSFLFWSQDHWSMAHWWVMYVNIYRINTVTGNIESGWASYQAGYIWSSDYESGGLFGGGGGHNAGGSAPYPNATINYSYQVITVADSGLYI